MLTVKGSKNRTHINAGWGTYTPQLSTNTAATVDDVDAAFFKTKIFRFVAATNNLLVNVLGSYDGGLTYPVVIEADVSVTTAAAVVKTYTDLYSHIRLQVRAAGAGAQGTLSTSFYGSWL